MHQQALMLNLMNTLHRSWSAVYIAQVQDVCVKELGQHHAEGLAVSITFKKAGSIPGPSLVQQWENDQPDGQP